MVDMALSDWIRMDANVGVGTYAQDLLAQAWGGGIELAVLAQTKKGQSLAPWISPRPLRCNLETRLKLP